MLQLQRPAGECPDDEGTCARAAESFCSSSSGENTAQTCTFGVGIPADFLERNKWLLI